MVKIICPKCQKPLEEEYKFCIFCGTPLENQPRVTVESEAEEQAEVVEPVETAPAVEAAKPVIPPEEDAKPSLQSAIVARVANSRFRKFIHVIKVICLVLWWIGFALATGGGVIASLSLGVPAGLIGVGITCFCAAIVAFIWSLARSFIIRPVLLIFETVILSFGVKKLAYNPYKTLQKYGCYQEYVDQQSCGQKAYVARLSLEVFDLSQTARYANVWGLFLLLIEKILNIVFQVFNSLVGLIISIPALVGILVLITGIAGLFNGVGSVAFAVIGVGVGLLVVAGVAMLFGLLIGFLEEMVTSIFSMPRIARIKSVLKKEAAPWIELYGYEEPEEPKETEKTDSKTEKDEKKTEEEDDFDAEMEAVIAEVEAEEAAKKKKD